jgi:hypothetical protein
VQPTNLSSGGRVTFSELFGIDEEQASRDLSPSMAKCLHRAHEDFALALDGKDPKNAESRGAYSDGGTTAWEDPCYTLVVLRQLSTICENGKGIEGAIFGPELRFRPTMDKPEVAAISRTRFVTMQSGKIEGAEFSGCAP